MVFGKTVLISVELHKTRSGFMALIDQTGKFPEIPLGFPQKPLEKVCHR
jgi:hypothetical protein